MTNRWSTMLYPVIFALVGAGIVSGGSPKDIRNMTIDERTRLLGLFVPSDSAYAVISRGGLNGSSKIEIFGSGHARITTSQGLLDRKTSVHEIDLSGNRELLRDFFDTLFLERFFELPKMEQRERVWLMSDGDYVLYKPATSDPVTVLIRAQVGGYRNEYITVLGETSSSVNAIIEMADRLVATEPPK